MINQALLKSKWFELKGKTVKLFSSFNKTRSVGHKQDTAEDQNFSLGKDIEEPSRNFDSSSSAVGGTKTFGVGTGATDASDISLRDRTFDEEDRVARH